MSVIDGIKDFIKSYAGLKDNAPVWVEYLGDEPTEYAIIPLAGSRIIETYVDDSRLMSYPFAFQSMESTADELERLETNGFYEAFAEWLDEQANEDNLPSLSTGKTSHGIEALGWGYLYKQGDSDTGIYQVQCRLIYEEEA